MESDQPYPAMPSLGFWLSYCRRRSGWSPFLPGGMSRAMSCVSAPVLPSIFGIVGWNVKIFDPLIVGAPDPLEPLVCGEATVAFVVAAVVFVVDVFDEVV